MPATHTVSHTQMRIYFPYFITSFAGILQRALYGHSRYFCELQKISYGWQSKYLSNFGVNLGEIVTGTAFGHRQSESYYDSRGSSAPTSEWTARAI